MPKAGILKDVDLRFNSGLADIQESWSCYERTGPCGKCTACVLRERAFAAHGLEDLARPPVMHGGDAHRTRQLGGE
jgi:7-cyano-7-deazaguanine synthase in queuosine biosynthesis